MAGQSLIIKFVNVELRDQFLDLLRSKAPDLLDKIIPAKTSSNIVVKNLTTDEINRIKCIAGPNARFFQDFDHQLFVDQE